MTAKNGNISVLLKVVLALAVVGAAVYFALQRFSDVAVVDEVTRDEALSAVPGSVTVYADKGIRELKSLLGGRVAEVAPMEPDFAFKKGDVLLKLDTSDLEREAKEAERNYNAAQEKRRLQVEASVEETVAQENLKTAQRMYDTNEISNDKLTEVKRALAAVKSRLAIEEFENKKLTADYQAAKDLRADLIKKMTVVAPEDGVVSTSTMWEGALISPGATIATFTSAKRQVTAKISEENIGSIRLGQEASVFLLAYPKETFKAKVSKLISEADEAQRFQIYLDVDIKPERLKHQQTGQVTVTVDRHPNQPLVPRRAIFNGNNVYVVENGRAHIRQIEVGFVSLNRVEVLKGLTPGELVIVENLDTYRDGQRVRTIKAK